MNTSNTMDARKGKGIKDVGYRYIDIENKNKIYINKRQIKKNI